MDNPITSTPSVQPPAATQPVTPRKLFWLAGGLVVLTLGITVGVFSAKFLNQSPNLSQLPPTQSPTPTSAPDLYREPDGSAATAGWKTYVSPNNHSVKYPENWTIISSNATEWKQQVGVPKFSVVNDGYKITFSFPSAFSPDICIFSDQSDFTKSFPDNPIMERSKCPGKFVEVKGDMFVFRRLSNPTTPSPHPPGEGYREWPIYTVYTKDNSGNFVTLPPVGYDIPVNYDPIIITEMDQILSTFKFTDQNKEICVLGQEYQNTAINPITCQCPSGYEWEVISNSFGPCRSGQAKDCPKTVQKCSPIN